MSKKMMENLKETLQDELNTLSKKGELTKESLDNIHKLVDTIKNIDKIMMSEEESGGYSQRGRYSMGYGNSSYNSYNNSMRGSSYDGNSMRGSYDGGGSNNYSGDGNSNNYSGDGRHGRDGDSDGRYSEEGSYARGRGRYSRDGGYSRHTEKERMIQKLEMMMEDAPSDKERMAIERCISQLEG